METLLRISDLSKSFPGVQALERIDLELTRGEVHALLGENGAGKSTLVKIIAGVYRRDRGRLVFRGREREFTNPGEASHSGISVIHQETSLIPCLTVLENIFLGREPTLGLGIIHRRRLEVEYRDICSTLDFWLPPQRPARELSVAEQKMVEIMKATVQRAVFIIMDEPTDALTDHEIPQLFRMIRDLKRQGITVLYITHYLAEVFQITDRITVLRDGRKVATVNTAAVTQGEIVRLMIGQELAGPASGARAAPEGRVTQRSGNKQRASGGSPFQGPPAGGSLPPRESLRVEGLRRGKAVRGVSFSVREGEILGITGVIGAGKTETARLLSGADRPEEGRIFIRGKRRHIQSPRDARRQGIGMLPEDRKVLGLLLDQEVHKNISLSALERFAPHMILNRSREMKACREQVEQLGIKVASLQQPVKFLSGGNQQKVVIARWLLSGPAILIMDEPTRGIDVGSKAEIHRLMGELAESGTSVLFISSEVPEIVQVAHRILVMKNGRIAGEYSSGVSAERIIRRLLEENSQ